MSLSLVLVYTIAHKHTRDDRRVVKRDAVEATVDAIVDIVYE